MSAAIGESAATQSPRVTPAQEICAIKARLGVTDAQFAWWLGVTRQTLTRWKAQARRDDGIVGKGCGVQPTTMHVQAARLVLVVRRAAPGMLGHLRYEDFYAELADLRGESMRLATEPDRLHLVALDGADDPE